MVTPVEVVSVIAIVAGLLLCLLGYLSYSRWDEPGSTTFGVFLVAWGSLPVLDIVVTSVSGGTGVSGFFWALAVAPWCLFALQYTGRSFGRRSGVALLVPAFGIVPWFWSVSNGADILAFQTFGIIVFTYYTAVALVGSLVVLRATGRYSHLSLTQGALLALVGVLPPATMNTFGILINRTSDLVAFGVYTTGFSASLLAVSLALFRYDVLDSTPAAGTVGEQAIARETDDLILITDGDGEVIVRNETANRRLPTTEQAALGAGLDRSLGVDSETLRARETVEVQTNEGVRQFDPQVRALTDQHNRQVGTMVSLRDVTRREIRRQRLEVLNRIVRHNLRNQASVIKANTEAVADELSDDQLLSYLDNATESVDELTDLGEKAKTIEELLGRDHDNRSAIDLPAFLDEVAAESTARWPRATVTVDGVDDVVVESDREVVRFILTNLVENAVEHADSGTPTVELRTHLADDRYPLVLEVADDGPGIPDREVEVIESGTETPLKHGSGVGLWVTSWAARELGGELAFPERDTTGSTVHVRLPHEPHEGSAAQSAGS